MSASSRRSSRLHPNDFGQYESPPSPPKSRARAASAKKVRTASVQASFGLVQPHGPAQQLHLDSLRLVVTVVRCGHAGFNICFQRRRFGAHSRWCTVPRKLRRATGKPNPVRCSVEDNRSCSFQQHERSWQEWRACGLVWPGRICSSSLHFRRVIRSISCSADAASGRGLYYHHCCGQSSALKLIGSHRRDERCRCRRCWCNFGCRRRRGLGCIRIGP